jgi:hypothetical protein
MCYVRVMDNVDLASLILFHEHNQSSFGGLAQVPQGFVSQMVRGERPIPSRMEEQFERLLAVGSPQSKKEELMYVVGRARGSGVIEVPDDPSGIQTFRSRGIASEIARHLRANGFPKAVVVPIWENGLSQLVLTNPTPTAVQADDALFRDHVRQFIKTKRTFQKP